MERENLLSVAMIVKDEENNIERALSSIKPYVDEIIVVDTGSTDRTVELARKYTDKIYFHEWKNDFSEARNNSLKYPTCEWVLIYDADEEVREDFTGIREFLQSLPKDVNTVYLPTISYLDWSLRKTEIASTARIFRNGTVYYESIIHNQPIYKGKVIEAPFKLYHYGYIWTRKLAKQKYERTRNMLVKTIKENPNMSGSQKMYYLVQLYKSESLSPDKTNMYKVANEIVDLFNQMTSKNSKIEIPPIIFEFFFVHGFLLMNHGYIQKAEKFFNYLSLSFKINNPDAYYAYLALSEQKGDFDGVIGYGEKFIKYVYEALEKPENYKWTIVSIKYIASGYALLAKAYLKKENFEKFKSNYLKALEWLPKTNENYQRVLFSPFVEDLIKIEDKSKVKDIVQEMIKFLYNNKLKYDPMWELIYAYKDYLIEIDRSILESLAETRFQKLFLKRLYENKDTLSEYIFGNEPKKFVYKNGVGSLILYFDFLADMNNPPQTLKFLSNFKDDEEYTISGVANALIGDVYLKLGNFKLAFEYYKKALEKLPEIHTFLKPVLDDLKTRLDNDIDGCFEELKKFYKSWSELPVEFSNIFPKNELEKLYLLSDTDLAKYISAIYLSDKDKSLAETLLKSVASKDKFEFYEHRLAKIYEEIPEKFKEGFELHLDSLKRNPKLADLKLGKYEFTGYYDVENTPVPNFSKVIWIGNISQHFSPLGIIHPIRAWEKKDEGFYIAYPKPTEEAINLYLKRKKELKIDDEIEKLEIEKVVNLILDLNEPEIFLDGGPEELKRILKEFGIEATEKADTVVSFNLVNLKEDLSKELKKYKKAVLFYYVSDFQERKDYVLSYPLITVIKFSSYLKQELEEMDYLVNAELVINKSLRTIIISRKL